MADTETFAVPSSRQGLFVGEAKPGERWRFSAKGTWRDWFVRCGPQGYRAFLFHALDLWPRLWNAPYFCLVGQIDERVDQPLRVLDPEVAQRVVVVMRPVDGEVDGFDQKLPSFFSLVGPARANAFAAPPWSRTAAGVGAAAGAR